MQVQIDHLFEHPRFVRLVAGWIYEEFWRDKPGYGVEKFEGLLRQADDAGRIPLSLIALSDGQPAGTAQLIRSDSERRPHLTPWLAALIVAEPYRRRGIGGLLVRRVAAEAARLGYAELIFGTDIPDFYARFGAGVHERFPGRLCIMRMALAGTDA